MITGNGPKENISLVRVMMRQVAQLKRLTSDLLDVNRAANGKLFIEKTQIDLGEVLSAAVETSRGFIKKCGQKLIVKNIDSQIVVDGDFSRLMQLVTNLLNNAAKFSKMGDQIELLMERQGTWAVVSVKDTGIGLQQDMLREIFNSYTQVEQSYSSTRGGLGLGLPLVKHIAQLHGGTVEARSEGPNRGAEFIVRLPLSEKV